MSPDQEVGSSSTTPHQWPNPQAISSICLISKSKRILEPAKHARFHEGLLIDAFKKNLPHKLQSNLSFSIFPRLHLNEVHNPILLVQEIHHTKIFRCFEQSCEKSFSSPKTRRLHLIDFHGIQKRLNNLYKKFGSGVSLIRPDWKARPEGSDTRGSKPLPIHRETSAQDKSKPITDDDSRMSMDIGEPEESHKENNNAQTAIDSVIDSVQQFSFVPRQIQFGKKAGSKSFLR
ncbi:hypothetical protein KEM48_002326 [Puccinia striiformis f. sp. tritici PST-130]|nr:hypothetical protein KEM48_002326 [Puccinia striiformis f. sp. tritici PST-130]